MSKPMFLQSPIPVKHTRLQNIFADVANEVEFLDVTPEAKASIRSLLTEASLLVRTLQQAGGDNPTLVAE